MDSSVRCWHVPKCITHLIIQLELHFLSLSLSLSARRCRVRGLVYVEFVWSSGFIWFLAWERKKGDWRWWGGEELLITVKREEKTHTHTYTYLHIFKGIYVNILEVGKLKPIPASPSSQYISPCPHPATPSNWGKPTAFTGGSKGENCCPPKCTCILLRKNQIIPIHACNDGIISKLIDCIL